MASSHHATPAQCLRDIGITEPIALQPSPDEPISLADEFSAIKRIYHKKVLVEHPDKGGDPEDFRRTRAAFEVLRAIYKENKVRGGSFTHYLKGPRTRGRRGAGVTVDEEAGESAESEYEEEDEEEEDNLDDLYEEFREGGIPSYEHFAEAAREEVPGYRVELAKSGRSKCKGCDDVIGKDEVRVGSLDPLAGSYGRWHHLSCWKVPKTVWSGLTRPSDRAAVLHDLMSMDEVLLSGMGDLGRINPAGRAALVDHVMNMDNWAKFPKRMRIAVSAEESAAAAKHQKRAENPTNLPPSTATSSMHPGVGFVMPYPGVNGAVDTKFLKGNTFVITGCFPEVSGEAAADAGADTIMVMIQSFGGKVITRFSKNTDYLLMGKNPTHRKFADARKKEIQVIDLRILKRLLTGEISMQQMKELPPLVCEHYNGDLYQPAVSGTAGVASASAGAGAIVVDDGASSFAQKPRAKASAAAAKANGTKPKASAKGKPKAGTAPKTPSSAAIIDLTDSTNATPVVPPAAASVASRQIVPAKPANNGGSKSKAVVPHTGKKGAFVMPRPGVNGAIAGLFNGKRFVLTGIFPEVGGGAGLNLGKDRVKGMIESFGGRVTSAVSGKTDYVLVGKDPGASKVGKAKNQGLPLLDLMSLNTLIYGQKRLEDAVNIEAPRITNFSKGYDTKYIGYY